MPRKRGDYPVKELVCSEYCGCAFLGKSGGRHVLCPFTHEKVRCDYAAILQSDFHKVLFLDYQPEPTDGMSNAKQYKTLVTKYIAGA